jgi:hypothetical protein
MLLPLMLVLSGADRAPFAASMIVGVGGADLLMLELGDASALRLNA